MRKKYDNHGLCFDHNTTHMISVIIIIIIIVIIIIITINIIIIIITIIIIQKIVPYMNLT